MAKRPLADADEIRAVVLGTMAAEALTALAGLRVLIRGKQKKVKTGGRARMEWERLPDRQACIWWVEYVAGKAVEIAQADNETKTIFEVVRVKRAIADDQEDDRAAGAAPEPASNP